MTEKNTNSVILDKNELRNVDAFLIAFIQKSNIEHGRWPSCLLSCVLTCDCYSLSTLFSPTLQGQAEQFSQINLS